MFRIIMICFLLFLVSGCTPAERQKLNVPVLSQIDAIGSTIAQAVGWCGDNGGSAQDVIAALQAISEKDPGTAADIARKMLQQVAANGTQIPPEVIALVQTAEGALAAEAVQNGMRALTPADKPSSPPPEPPAAPPPPGKILPLSSSPAPAMLNGRVTTYGTLPKPKRLTRYAAMNIIHGMTCSCG